MEDRYLLTNTLKQKRAELDISQAVLAELVQVSRQTIIAIENGDYNPSLLLALKIAEALGTSVTTIFKLSKEKNESA